MTTTTIPSLSHHVQAFFGNYLTSQRAMSPNTVLSYRDTFKLFLAFAARHHQKVVAALNFDDVGPDTVLAFLDDVEKQRRCSVRTRNARLAALHTFFRYVAEREPGVLHTCQRVNAIPVKKTQIPTPVYLEHDEVLCILRSIDRSTALGRRDHLLVHLLYETGARAQEIARLRTSALRLSDPYQARFLGKGRKERICPLRATTATLIRQFLRERGVGDHEDVSLFVGPRGETLTRYGILRAVQRRVRQATASLPTLASKRIGAHTFRHSAAVHLLRSGNDLTVIRSWLGHVSITTTDHYTEIDLEMKKRALEASEPAPTPGRSSWKKDPDLLAWLEAL